MYYAHKQSPKQQADAGFAVEFEWDNDPLEGYEYRWLHNNSSGISYVPSIADDGDISVAAVCLDDLIENSDLPPPTCIKVDVEGGEYRALIGAREFLSRAHPVIFLSTHGRDIHADCCQLLRQCKFDLISLDGKELEKSSSILAIDGT